VADRVGQEHDTDVVGRLVQGPSGGIVETRGAGEDRLDASIAVDKGLVHIGGNVGRLLVQRVNLVDEEVGRSLHLAGEPVKRAIRGETTATQFFLLACDVDRGRVEDSVQGAQGDGRDCRVVGRLQSRVELARGDRVDEGLERRVATNNATALGEMAALGGAGSVLGQADADGRIEHLEAEKVLDVLKDGHLLVVEGRDRVVRGRGRYARRDWDERGRLRRRAIVLDHRHRHEDLTRAISGHRKRRRDRVGVRKGNLHTVTMP